MATEIVSRLWDPISRNLTHSIKVEEHVLAIRKAIKKLIETKKDVERKVDVAVRKGLTPRHEVTVWLERVEATEVEVTKIEAAFDQRRRFLKYFSWSNYRLGKKAAEILTNVVELQNEGDLSNVDVCQGRKIDVECLPWSEGWDLFQEMVGEETMNSHPEIRELAIMVAKECGGLTLVLNTIGRAMATKKTPEEWKYAVVVLKKLASDFLVLEDKVFSLLKFSFDSLCDDMMRSCFLYCSLFADGISIKKDELVGYWIGEGFFDECDELVEAHNKGRNLIRKLKDRYLLEDGSDEEQDVKIHPDIREFALRIASDCGENKNTFLVAAMVGLTKAPMLEMWKKAKRISLMDNKLKALKKTPRCPNLLTLLLKGNEDLSNFSNSFFQFMPFLRVLDISFTQINKLPRGLGKLVNLRYLNLSGTGLEEFPIEIGEFVELQHLDLSFTQLEELPVRMGKLEKLKHLDLSFTDCLDRIPHNVLAGLSNLQVLNMFRSNYTYWKVEGSDDYEGWVDPRELECLEQLSEIGITVSNDHALNKVVQSTIFTKFTRLLATRDCNPSPCFEHSSTFENMTRLKTLHIDGCGELNVLTISEEVEGDNQLLPKLEDLYLWNLDKLKSIFVPRVCLRTLRSININGCHELKNVSWVLRLPSLQEIELMNCYGIEEIIGDEVEAEAQDLIAFPRLKRITLINLPELKRICRHIFAFPLLQSLAANYCPELKRLPFGHQSTNKALLQIHGTNKWWEMLDWDDESIKSTFLPFFIHYEQWN